MYFFIILTLFLSSITLQAQNKNLSNHDCDNKEDCRIICEATDFDSFSASACLKFIKYVKKDNPNIDEQVKKLNEYLNNLDDYEISARDSNAFCSSDHKKAKSAISEYQNIIQSYSIIIRSMIYAANKGCFMSPVAQKEAWFEKMKSENYRINAIAESCKVKAELLLKYKNYFWLGDIGSADIINDINTAMLLACHVPANNDDKWGYCNQWQKIFSDEAQKNEKEGSMITSKKMLSYAIKAALTSCNHRKLKASCAFVNEEYDKFCNEECSSTAYASQFLSQRDCNICPSKEVISKPKLIQQQIPTQQEGSSGTTSGDSSSTPDTW